MPPTNRRTYLQSDSFRKRRKKRLGLTISLGLISLVVLIFLFSQLSQASFLSIREVQVSGADSDIVAGIKDAANQKIQGKYLGLFSKASNILYPRSDIAAAVVTTSPRVESVYVHLSGLHALVIEVKQKQPSSIICPKLPNIDGDILEADEPKECFFADKTGLIFEEVATTSPQTISPQMTDHTSLNMFYIPALADQYATTTYLAHTALAGDELTQLNDFANGARSAGMDVKAVLVKGGGEYEMYFNNSGLNGASTNLTVVYFNRIKPLSEQLTHLIAFWDNSVKNTPAGNKSLSLDYIDIRYGTNVIYRLNQ